MPRPLHELRERLLRAGIAPRHVRRYLAELSDHLADLTAEEQRNGLARADAESAALARLGDPEHLAQAMIRQPQLRAWSARAPWAAFGLVPIAALVAAYTVAMLILWTGWQLFLPTAVTPFGNHTTGLANAYFQLGRALYYTAPLFIGWVISAMAARQRIAPAWTAFGLCLLAWIAVSVRVHAWRSSSGAARVGVRLALHPWNARLAPAAVVFAWLAGPYFVWYVAKRFFVPNARPESSIEHSASSR
jgi:hypothetical protein